MKPPELERPWWLLPRGHLHPLWWIGLAAALAWVDYLNGPGTQFPVLYIIPMILAAWYSGRWPALMLAITMPMVHILLLVLWWQPDNIGTLVAAASFRGAVIMVLALWFARFSEHERALEHHVQTLEGLLPICTFCKSIRNDAGEWERLEKFISTRSEAQFSHGFCPACQKTHYPDPADSSPAAARL